jgi:hypothetical protein
MDSPDFVVCRSVLDDPAPSPWGIPVRAIPVLDPANDLFPVGRFWYYTQTSSGMEKWLPVNAFDMPDYLREYFVFSPGDMWRPEIDPEGVAVRSALSMAKTWEHAMTGVPNCPLVFPKLRPAMFCSVLGIAGEIDPASGDIVKLCGYYGPFSVDIDAATIGGAIGDTRKLATSLVSDWMLTPNQYGACPFRIAASGKKGFHILIPETFFNRARYYSHEHQTFRNLPAIYRRMAEIIANVAGVKVDMTVYSGGKGRMLRTYGVKRPDNGRYKVPVSYEQLLTMTPEDYDRLTRTPLSMYEFPPLTPVFSPRLEELFNRCREEVEAKAKADSDPESGTAGHASLAVTGKRRELLARMLDALLDGQLSVEPGDDRGWNQISVQLATAAHAVGLTEAQMLEKARSLLNIYRGDGRRYGSIELRARELIHQYHYWAKRDGFRIKAFCGILPTPYRRDFYQAWTKMEERA